MVCRLQVALSSSSWDDTNVFTGGISLTDGRNKLTYPNYVSYQLQWN